MKALTRLALFALLTGCAVLTGFAQSSLNAEGAASAGVITPKPPKNEPVAQVESDSSQLRWRLRVEHAGVVLTVSSPNGRVFRKEFKPGQSPSFEIRDDNGAVLPDGQYQYELRVIPALSDGVKASLKRSREDGDSNEVEQQLRRDGLLPSAMEQSGAFAVLNGSFLRGGAEEEPRMPNPAQPNAAPSPSKKNGSSSSAGGGRVNPQDVVQADDLIVQGSACVGLDCVNNEAFGFDTIRLKENNTRIKFDDTSTAAGFPNFDWQLTANDSASGGANKFSIEDITSARVPFTITGAAANNSIFVSSSGRVGFRTSTPVLDLHVLTGNTPAFRMDQDASGGFTAQVWDVAGNEANFFVRDVTGGSRLPLRIRPGAPTSSIDIAASGNVGVGTASPSDKVHVLGSGDVATLLRVQNANNGAATQAAVAVQANTAGADYKAHADARTITRWGVTLGGWVEFLQTSGSGLAVGSQNSTPFILGTNSLDRIHIAPDGSIGISGESSPTNPLQHTSGAKLTAGGVWTNASSRALKTNIRSLTAGEAFGALRGLDPVRFQYKAESGTEHVGFIAEDVPDLVATDDRKTLSPMDIVAVLTKVVQEQEKSIAELKATVARLESGRTKTAVARRETKRTKTAGERR